MKFTWLFGSSMEAHHLLWTYLAVWLIQGGYLAWIVWQWMHTDAPADALDSRRPRIFRLCIEKERSRRLTAPLSED